MTNTDQILKQTEKYDVVTFDVFDTLIIRDVMKPAHVFRLAYGWAGRYMRVAAELLARKLSKKQEVTLDDIYKFLPFSPNKEIECEKKICRANPKILEIVNKLIEQGKKVYAISDMYLDKDTISEILINSGYDIPVFVSSEYDCTKRDGTLFREFLKELDYSVDKVIHIGDDKESDILGAQKAGIASIHIEKHSNELAYVKYGIRNSEYASFINHGISELVDPVERIGYEIVGPIILSFCQWIHEKYVEQGFERLYFLARDMRFTYERYKEFYPDDKAYYLCVSRKSLASAKEYPNEFIEYLRKEKCFGNIAVVDTGWVGGMQVAIENYAKQIDNNTDLGGLYLGTKLAFKKIKRSSKSFSCHFVTKLEQFRCQLFPPFMETLIGCNEKQVISYSDGSPVFSENTAYNETNQIKIGAENFINDWVDLKNNAKIPSFYVRIPFERMFYCPLSDHIELMGKLHYEDFKTTSIVSFDQNCPYWKKPGRFLSDLSDSGWKGAYLKGFGFLYPIMLFLYYIFGSLRLYFKDVKAIKNKKINSNPNSI